MRCAHRSAWGRMVNDQTRLPRHSRYHHAFAVSSDCRVWYDPRCIQGALRVRTLARRAALAGAASDDRRAVAHPLSEGSCKRSHAMAFFSSAPDADIKHTLAREPAIGIPFSQLNEAVMRGDAPFTAGERELLAAYVSALNGCDYCQCEHAALA